MLLGEDLGKLLFQIALDSPLSLCSILKTARSGHVHNHDASLGVQPSDRGNAVLEFILTWNLNPC